MTSISSACMRLLRSAVASFVAETAIIESVPSPCPIPAGDLVVFCIATCLQDQTVNLVVESCLHSLGCPRREVSSCVWKLGLGGAPLFFEARACEAGRCAW